MCNKRFLIVILVICIVTVNCVDKSIFSDCNSELSRQARNELQNKFYSYVEGNDYTLPLSCPFHQDNDLFGMLQSKINKLRSSRYKCLECGKSFRSEQFIEEHILDNHMELFDSQVGKICLADYCHMLKCEDTVVEQQIYKTGSLCNDKEMEKLRFECYSILHSCFPLNENLQEVANEIQVQLCDHLKCSEAFDDAETTSPFWWVVKVCLLFLLLILIIIFYFGIVMWKKDVNVSNKLRRISKDNRPLSQKITSKFAPTKVKGY